MSTTSKAFSKFGIIQLKSDEKFNFSDMKRTGHSRDRRIKRYSIRWVGDDKKASLHAPKHGDNYYTRQMPVRDWLKTNNSTSSYREVFTRKASKKIMLFDSSSTFFTTVPKETKGAIQANQETKSYKNYRKIALANNARKHLRFSKKANKIIK